MPPPGMTVFPSKGIVIAKGGLIPTVDIDVKVPHLGSYELAVWTGNGRKGAVIRRGNTADSIKDEFRIVRKRATLPRLNGRILTWIIWIQRTRKGSRTPWSFSFDFSQGNTPLDRVSKQGPMSADVVGFRGSYDLTVV